MGKKFKKLDIILSKRGIEDENKKKFTYFGYFMGGGGIEFLTSLMAIKNLSSGLRMVKYYLKLMACLPFRLFASIKPKFGAYNMEKKKDGIVVRANIAIAE